MLRGFVEKNTPWRFLIIIAGGWCVFSIQLHGALYEKGSLWKYDTTSTSIARASSEARLRTSNASLACSNTFNDTLTMLQYLAEEARKPYHSLQLLHDMAINTDRVRPLLPANWRGRSLRLPEPVNESDFLNSGSVAALPPRLRRSICRVEKADDSSVVNNMSRLPFVRDSYVLVQRSFVMFHTDYTTDLKEPIFPENGSVLQHPFCDMRKCNQTKYPFIYLLVDHRNRLNNLLRLVRTVRDSHVQCGDIPDWSKCLCLYISDYGTDMDSPLADSLANVWNGHIRLLSRRNVKSHFSRGGVSGTCFI